MKRKILGIFGAFLMIGAGLINIEGAYARDPDRDLYGDPDSSQSSGGSSTSGGSTSGGVTSTCGGSFLGFKPWYDGLCIKSGDQADMVPICETDNCEPNSKSLNVFIWTIVLNVLFDLGLAVGMIAVAMVIYSGYLYITSQGDAAKLAKGKKSLMSAIIGVVIAMGATVIVNTFKIILNINTNGWNQGTVTQADVQNAFNWAYGIAGLVAVVFIIKSGVDYLMSTGDPSKIKKATQGLIFSVVGLVIVLLASLITGFVIGSVGGTL